MDRYVGKLQDKCGPFSRPIAMGRQSSPHFLRGTGTAVQTETMTTFLSGETVGKNANQVFLSDTYAIVNNFDSNRVFPRPCSNAKLTVGFQLPT